MSASAVPSPADIPALMRIERGPGFEQFVGRWSLEEHATELARLSSRYLVRRRNGEIQGFVLLQDLDEPNRCVHLRRIAVAEPGAGLGAELLEAALAFVFDETPAHRLQLRVYVENTRAQRAYSRAGFKAEGVLRDVARTPDGAFRSMIVMSILRPELRQIRLRTLQTNSLISDT